MKKLLLLSAMFLPMLTFSQTNWTDYNYITKGYFTTLEQGLDFKQGYGMKELLRGSAFRGSFSSNTYYFSYKAYVKKEKPDSTIAIMAILFQNDKVQKVFCIPTANTEGDIWKAFWADLTARLYGDQKETLLKDMFTYFTDLLYSYESTKKRRQ